MATSERVAWTVDEILGDRSFDATRPMVPASWVGAGSLDFLAEDERLLLNHCRAFSYVHLLGNYEEFIPVHLGDTVTQQWHGDRMNLRALLRFGEEEMKHQQLFSRAEILLERSCGHSFGRYFGPYKKKVTELTEAILAYPSLPRFLILTALEWGTQRHYAESTRDQGVDPLYVDILKAHWIEEAQHAKSDTLEIARLARGMSAEELAAAFAQVAGIGGLVDATVDGQVEKEIETLEQVGCRALSDGERTRLRDALHRSLSEIIAGVSLTHPSFSKVALELSEEGAAKLGIVGN